MMLRRGILTRHSDYSVKKQEWMRFCTGESATKPQKVISFHVFVACKRPQRIYVQLPLSCYSLLDQKNTNDLMPWTQFWGQQKVKCPFLRSPCSRSVLPGHGALSIKLRGDLCTGKRHYIKTAESSSYVLIFHQIAKRSDFYIILFKGKKEMGRTGAGKPKNGPVLVPMGPSSYINIYA